MVQLFQTEHPFGFPWPAQVFAVLNKYPNPLAPHVVSMDVLDRTILEDGTIRTERLIGIQQDSPKWVNRMLGSQDTTYCREISFVVPSSLPNPSLSPKEAQATAHEEPPKLLMASTNLTLSHIMQCREAISYIPHPWPHVPVTTAAQLAPSLLSDHPPPPPPPSHPLSHPSLPPRTLFSQSALIFTTGKLAAERHPPIGISSHSPIKPLSFPAASTFPQRAAGKKIEQWASSRFETNAETGQGAMNWAAERFWQDEWRNAGLEKAAA